VIHRAPFVRRSGSLLLLAAALVVPTSAARAQDTGACIAASESALALKKADKLMDARRQLSLCAAPSCPDVVKGSCEKRLAEVSQAIPSIVLFATDATGNDLTAVKLSIDGAAYADRLDGRAIELDPGEHELRLEVAGQPPTVKRLVLHQGEQGRRESVVVGPPPAATPVPPPAASIAADAEPSPGGTQRTIGWIVGGVGVAGLTAGGVFGLLAISAHNSYEQHCGNNIGAPSSNDCDSTGRSGQSDASTKATLSTVFFVGGGVAATAGMTLLLTAPKSITGTQVGVGPDGIVVQGRF